MKRINSPTIAGTDPSGGAGIQADLKTSGTGAYWSSLSYYCTGGAKYPWRTVGVSH